jgi:hypothetical protein
MGKIERIQVPPEDRERLARLVRDRNTPQKIVWRSRIVLLAGDGIGAVEVAARVSKSVLTVRRWRRRYAAKGVDGFLQSWKPAAANNHDPARLVVGKASAPIDTDPVVSSARTAQWWPSSESADRCLGAKAADRLLEICDHRGCLGRSRDNGHLKTKAFPFSIFRGLISSGGSR